MGLIDRLARYAPGLPALARYQIADLPRDVFAGLSVAAVALPVGVAYAELAGFDPVIGLYSSILPLVAYALFGTSRQLIVGPDAATCALIAAAVAPLAAGNPENYHALSLTLTLLAGLFCIAGSFLRLGGLADFLSRPILIGFLHGIALSILLGQLGKLFGFGMEASGIVPRLIEFVSKFGLTHLPTLAVGAGTFVVLAIAPRFLPRLPAALVAMVAAALAVAVFDLESKGVKTIGTVPAGLPDLVLPSFALDTLGPLAASAAGVALIAFSSMVITARSFAAKNRYDVDVDREFSALGAANIASALSQGFAISGADSRTAMNDAAGGRTQVAGLVAAAAVAVVLLFLTKPLQYLPIAALGAVLVKAAFSLVDLSALRFIYRLDTREFFLSVLTTLGVVVAGAIDAILIAVILALLRFVRLSSRPMVELLGEVPGLPGFHSVARHADATRREGLLIFRFNAPIVFFNAPYFKRELMAAASAAGGDLKWLVIDMLPITLVDATGVVTASDAFDELAARGVVIALAGRQTEIRQWTEEHGFGSSFPKSRHYPTLRQAVRAFRDENLQPANSTAPAPPPL